MTAQSATTGASGGTYSPGKIETENRAYHEYRQAEEPAKSAALYRLMVALRRHAERMVWMVLHRDDHHLAEEMVTDLILELDAFQGTSKFSSWTHSRFRNRCIDELRYHRRHLGPPLELNYDQAVDLRLDERIELDQFLARLPDDTGQVVALALEGRTIRGIAAEVRKPKSEVHRILQEIYVR